VIPESVRERLALKPGTQFVVIGDADVVILKTIAPPALSDFTKLVARARRQARLAGVRKADVTRVVKEVRTAR
jgi:bifunctional DNA-binding transcriptional regulator/antitoxin component of YhaV-PrlF toxin-antitoxin module